MIKTAQQLIQTGQRAIVVFTCGDEFTFSQNGDGFTGNWRAGEKTLEGIDKVIIYHRDDHTRSQHGLHG